jgi:hypothetical protein
MKQREMAIPTAAQITMQKQKKYENLSQYDAFKNS